MFKSSTNSDKIKEIESRLVDFIRVYNRGMDRIKDTRRALDRQGIRIYSVDCEEKQIDLNQLHNDFYLLLNELGYEIVEQDLPNRKIVKKDE